MFFTEAAAWWVVNMSSGTTARSQELFSDHSDVPKHICFTCIFHPTNDFMLKHVREQILFSPYRLFRLQVKWFSLDLAQMSDLTRPLRFRPEPKEINFTSCVSFISVLWKILFSHSWEWWETEYSPWTACTW